MVTTQGLAEIVLMVADVQASRRFYEGTLGMKVISPELGGPVFLSMGESGGVPQQIVLIPRPANAPAQPPERTSRSFHHLGLVVSPGSLQAARKQLEDDGFEVRTGEHPFLPVDAIYIDDPDGNEVELVAAR
jgi:catechol 2,3-dioxygenase-like lactoylglutathione lyase family enzyme